MIIIMIDNENIYRNYNHTIHTDDIDNKQQ